MKNTVRTQMIKFFTEKERRLFLISCFILTMVFFSVYFILSLSLSKTPAFNLNNILFEIDTQRVITDVTVFDSDHYRTKVHPLFVIFMNPPGELLEIITHNPLLSVIFLNSLLGAFGVALFFIFINQILKNRWTCVLITILFGVSASHLISSIIPNTSSLSICSLLTTYILLGITLRRKKLDLFPWILAGIFTLGVTTTNFMQTLICFSICVFIIYKHRGFLLGFIKIVYFSISVIGISAILAVLQKAIYPTSVLFFLPEAYEEEITYASFLIFQSPSPVLWQLFRHFFYVNFIAPYPSVFSLEGHSLPGITFTSPEKFGFFGISGLVFWFSTWLTIVYFLIKQYRKKIFLSNESKYAVIAMTLSLLFNLILHCFYGVGERGKIEYFLYTGNFSFLILGIAGITSLVPDKIFNGLLLCTILLTFINNILVICKIIGIYSSLV